ncbi:hypothetical protein Tco_1503386 [Tanacetum coccineum]
MFIRLITLAIIDPEHFENKYHNDLAWRRETTPDDVQKDGYYAVKQYGANEFTMEKRTSHMCVVNPSSPKITPKEEHVTLDRPESPNPFLPASQVDFTFIEITFTTNNEVALLYPLHPNQEYFKDVSDFISKCCLNEAFTRASTQYKEYLSEFWYTAKTLESSKVWVSTPTCGVRGDTGERLGQKEL